MTKKNRLVPSEPLPPALPPALRAAGADDVLKRYFAPVDRQVALWTSALAWVGTPFVERQRKRGAGVDCVQLAGAIYIECGLVDKFEPGHYAIDGGDHEDRSRVLDWLTASTAFARSAMAATLVAGDIVCFRNGRTAWHVAIVLAVDGENAAMIHCLRGPGTVIAQLQDETWRSRLTAVFTPVDGLARSAVAATLVA